MIKHKVSLAAAIALAVSQSAYANDINVNGFLSVGASMLDNDDVSIAGADTTGGFKNDTILGLQISKQVNDKTSVTGQLVSRGEQDYKTEASWAFVTYNANNNTDLRMGRLRVPAFYYSDFLEVGYAYNWVRPPVEVYRLPFSSIDGLDLTHSYSAGSVDGSVQVYYGRFQGDMAIGGDEEYSTDAKNLTGIVLSNSFGNFGTRLSYHRAEINIDAAAGDGTALGNAIGAATAIAAVPAGINVGTATGNAALAGFTGIGDASAADDFAPDGQTTTFMQAAVSYDNGDVSMVAEWTALENDYLAIPDDTAWMVTVAKRFGDYTPHLTYSYDKDEYESGSEGDLQEALGLAFEQSSITLGLRYDYDAATALKFEVQTNNEKNDSTDLDETGTLYSVALDLVF